jgi:tRNA threonylcarbamoyladenosine biosynthesis protein TsaE
MGVQQRDLASLHDTQLFAQEFARELQGGESIALIGSLGAGKTTFTQFLLAALGVTDDVVSPTFALAHEYQGAPLTIEHWDLYRLSAIPDELFERVRSGHLRIVEWADRFEEVLAACSHHLIFSLHDATLMRSVSIERVVSR